MNSWTINDNQLATTWMFSKSDISSKTASAYMFLDISCPVEQALRRCICSFNDAEKLYELRFNYTNDKTHCPFFYYEVEHWEHLDDSVRLEENNGGVSFNSIHWDNKHYSFQKRYIVYTFSMIVDYIESKLDVTHKIVKSPLNKDKFLIWICTKNGTTIKFLRSDENCIEWDESQNAAKAIYNFYKRYWDKDELR